MAEPLWKWDELVTATGGIAEGAAAGGVTGVSIDTRTLQKGDLFVALRGDNQDGHVYVSKAFETGAGAALVGNEFVTPAGSGPLMRVDDTLKAMERLGVAARARLSPEARIIAVTGSVGKTSTKEMLRLCLSSVDPHTHVSEQSYNNHWGVPLTLARMPRNTKYGVFEIGMNHAGEIAPLTKFVRPHVVIIRDVGPAHIEYFGTIDKIIDAKAEIMLGLNDLEGDLVPRIAILEKMRDGLEALSLKAHYAGAAVLYSGNKLGNPPLTPHYALINFESAYNGRTSKFNCSVIGRHLTVELGAAGVHQVKNAIASIGACQALGLDPGAVVGALKKFKSGDGRGSWSEYPVNQRSVILINESYNANPLSMEAALESLWYSFAGRNDVRRIAVLGDMRELGSHSEFYHRRLAEKIFYSHAASVYLCGEHMRKLADEFERIMDHGSDLGVELGAQIKEDLEGRIFHSARPQDLISPLLAAIAPGDVIMIKGSLGTRMAPIVEAVKKHLTEWEKQK